MDIEKLIEDLRGLLKQYGEKIPYGELVGARGLIQGLVIWYGKTQSRILSSRPPPPSPRSRPKTKG